MALLTRFSVAGLRYPVSSEFLFDYCVLLRNVIVFSGPTVATSLLGLCLSHITTERISTFLSSFSSAQQEKKQIALCKVFFSDVLDHHHSSNNIKNISTPATFLQRMKETVSNNEEALGLEQIFSSPQK
jgi:hypothetical protein